MGNEKAAYTANSSVEGNIGQRVWRCIRQMNTADPARLRAKAVIDCTRDYTYEQMFAEWERYARVFTGLGVTGKNGSRVAIGGTISAEPLFAFYGLNMTGAEVSMFSYPDFLPDGQWKTMLEKERITDLILSDIMITPERWPEFIQVKEELGLRNIILLHSRLGGPCAGPAELVYNEYNYHVLKKLDSTVFMSALFPVFADTEIAFAPDDPEHIAIITHTSGTTKGTRKPLPYTERSVNLVSISPMDAEFLDLLNATQNRVAPSFDFSSFLCMCLMNSTFAHCDTVVLTFFGFMHPKFYRAVGYYKLHTFFTSGFMFDSWMKRGDIDVDFSSLKVLSCGGSYLPPEKLRKYEDFAHRHGYLGRISRGYGMSETGGAQLAVPPGCTDDILGFPSPEENYLVFDESDGQYHCASEGERTGILYITSDSMCLNTLDGETLFEFTNINGRNFICTNDEVHVNPDGSFSYAGRADRYFVNNEGVTFKAGLVEKLMSQQPQIEKCAVVPVLDKRIHDTVPVLYVIPEVEGSAGVEIVRMALVRIYIEGGLLKDCCLPAQFVIVDRIPCNANGKIDVYRITRDRLKGKAYNILPVKTDGSVSDIAVELSEQLDSITGGTLPEGMGSGSALGIYELFNPAPASKDAVGSPFSIPFNLLRENTDNRRSSKMFSFFDNQQNPFINMMNAEGQAEGGDSTMPMPQFIQQAFMMQMQFMLNMCMMPLYMIQNMASMMGGFSGDSASEEASSGQTDGFKLGNMRIPPEVLGTLLSMDMSPENLEKLQKVLDIVFEAIPKGNTSNAE